MHLYWYVPEDLMYLQVRAGRRMSRDLVCDEDVEPRLAL